MRVYKTEHANPASEWEDLATLARRMHVRKSFIGYPLDMDVFTAILCAHRENVHANFPCGALCDRDILL